MRPALAFQSIFERAASVYSHWRADRGKRVLVNEILSIQIVTATIIGALAIVALYWGGQWVLKDSYGRWAQQWTGELNELGAPLYLDNDGEAKFRLESFVGRYPEIEQVSYYSPNGNLLFSVANSDVSETPEALSTKKLEKAKLLIGTDEPYLLDGGILNPRQFDIVAPIWIESLSEADLFNFDADITPATAATELIGYVNIQLDYLIFHDELLANIRTVVLILAALLAIFVWTSHRTLKKALCSFSNLQLPIRQLAQGNLDVEFEPAEHREISDIVEALEKTASALSERDSRLLELANHDGLTGLLNRRRFVEDLKEELTRIVQDKHVSALFFIDLDRFKYVNDSCGHPAGDRLIRRVADELLETVDVTSGTVARFGGDEFVVLLRNTSSQSARTSAEKILTNVRRLAHFEDERIFHVHCSIGIVMIDGSNTDQDDLVAKADIACHEAKAAGRNRVSFFEQSEERSTRTSADVGWMNKLRTAIDEDSFELRFQPINRIDNGQTIHHEVLIRLRDQDGRIVGPDAFLPSAIRFGLMSEIDFLVIRKAAKAWANFDSGQQALRLSINLSANAFESDDLAATVASTFKEFKVDPSRITFEITESLAIRRPQNVEQQIDQLRKLGCMLALDDFGTGYSSFSYLQKLQFDFIKIDGIFVQDILHNPVDQKMIRLIAEIGSEANMQTVAEYVQNAESLALLGELGVDLAQGYFVGRPARSPQFRSTPISLSSRRSRRSLRQ
ncbi:MAG TPA: EAL domain-containing protein [Woeseiaceae bacterium]|nr:EAL domain-containing protein [Woeseiaceae bacterium]